MDDSQTLYAEDTVSRLVGLLKAAFGDSYTYYDAWPTAMPPTFPVMIVQLIHTKMTVGPTSTDEVPETVEITVMFNQADAAGSTNVRTTTRRHLQNVIQGQDPTNTNQYKPDTVAYVLRTYLTMTEWLINSDVDIKYDITPPPELPTMAAATVTLTTWRRTVVQGRQ
jgi:hypothetical protein